MINANASNLQVQALPQEKVEHELFAFDDDQHPAFKLVAFWNSMGVLGTDMVVHHA